MNKRFRNALLIGIMLIATVLRIWQLGNVPISPDWDEAALAYDAKSLFLTGRDEYGEFLPAVLRSFDDYKPALYAYFSIPSVMLFGMNSFAVRLPSAVFGILTVLSLYFLVKKLFKREDIALLSAFFLAISPWHLQFSRVAFETNVGLAFNVFTVLFFLKGLKKPWFLILSAVCAGLNLSVYQSERVFTPLLVLVLVIIYRKELFAIPKKYISGAFVAGLLTVLPLVLYIVSHQQALVRVRATSIFSNQTPVLARIIPRLEDDKKRNDLIGLVFDNRRVTYTKLIVESYLVHYDLNWLFIKGDINRHKAPGMGLLFLVTLPLVFLGIYRFLFENFDKRSKYTILSWFLLAPVPAAITFETPHAVRTLNAVPIYQIFIAIGSIVFIAYVSKVTHKIAKIPIKYLVFTLSFLFLIFNFLYYINQYFVQQNYFHAQDWQYGYEEAVKEANKIRNDYKKVIVSDKQPMDKSYMFFLYYLDYPPHVYQKIGKNSAGSFDSTHHFENYEFRPFEWEKEKTTQDVLFIGSPKDFPTEIVSDKTIFNPDGTPAILFVDTK
jgi:4-amino-4-deoxy-L-arabinose transferase-like glycosyltransferase